MKKILNLCLLILCIIVFMGCNTDNKYNYNTEINTDKIVFEKKILTLGTDMKMYNSSDDYIGIIKEKIFNVTSTFNYYDVNDRFIARAHQQFFSLGTKIDITDAQGNKIGSIEQELLESMFSFYSIYKIYDSNHKIIAKSDKLDLFTSHVYIYGNDVNINLHQRAFTFFDTWDMEIKGNIDERLIYFIPGFIASSQSKNDDEDEK